MIINDIKKLAKENKVIVLFDMDGVLAEYGVGEKERIASNEPNLFLNARPLFENIKKAKRISKIKNVTVGIQSNCQYKEQKQDKKTWLQKYVPFVSKEDINIIAYKDEEYDLSNKQALKVNYIKEKYQNGEIVILIDDDHRIIKETLKQGVKVYHVSSLID